MMLEKIEQHREAGAPAVVAVETLLEEACTLQASDIHLEPHLHKIVIRFRIDGLLSVHKILQEPLASQIVARIKVLSGIDITERRLPHDGGWAHRRDTNSLIDIRVSTFPTLHGEKVVLRLLGKTVSGMPLQELGLSSDVALALDEIASKSHGFIIATGPTGSGKTTTLYALLARLKTDHMNVVTLEDPVEYHYPGAMQSQIHPAIGFTFAQGLRSLLRQDPDIMLLGEMRDSETARVAVQAALTGHLVLSTLHTNNAPSGLLRLLDMGIEPYLVCASLSALLAQRLARRVCTNCSQSVALTSQQARYVQARSLELDRTVKGAGCELCRGTGYKGRIGIYEFFPIPEDTKALLAHATSERALYKAALDLGMRPLLFDAVEKAKLGILGVEEIIRCSM